LGMGAIAISPYQDRQICGVPGASSEGSGRDRSR